MAAWAIYLLWVHLFLLSHACEQFGKSTNCGHKMMVRNRNDGVGQRLDLAYRSYA